MDGKENTKGVNTEEENEDVEDQNNQSGTGDNGGDNKGGKGTGDNGGSAKTFTQDQVTRMMTREKNQGKAAAYKELGIDPKDTKMVKMFQAFVASQKSDEQKAAEKQAEDNQKAQENEMRILKAEAKAEAMMLGIKKQYVEDAVALAISKLTDDTDIKTLLGEYKTKYPIWFEDGAGGDEDDNGKKGKTGQRGTGSSVKGDNGGKAGNGKEASGMGARLAAQRKASAPKKSFWS